MKPFRVSAEWIAFAHGPGADDRQPTAVYLCGLITERNYVLVPPYRVDLVDEIASVAELYDDPHERRRCAAARRLLKRAQAWLSRARRERTRAYFVQQGIMTRK